MKNRNRMIVNCVTASLMYYWSLPALAEQSSSEIKIVRDEYGMPHIYANDTWHLFYGYGYVVAQDRLFQMEMARRSTQGTVAEVLGKDFVKFDKDIRRNYFYWMLSGRKLLPFPQRICPFCKATLME